MWSEKIEYSVKTRGLKLAIFLQKSMNKTKRAVKFLQTRSRAHQTGHIYSHIHHKKKRQKLEQNLCYKPTKIRPQ